MADIIHRVGVKAAVSSVYAALSTVEGVAGWWTQETSGSSALGRTIGVRFLAADGREIGSMAMEVAALDSNRKVQWHVTAGPEEWLGTDVTFTLSQQDDYTIVLFRHQNWREANEFMSHCSMKWATFMLSLKQLLETGKGQPSPNDIKIDNWN